MLLQAVYGEGIASYMNDGGMDLAPRNDDDVRFQFTARCSFGATL